jgi:hypothetical protein
MGSAQPQSSDGYTDVSLGRHGFILAHLIDALILVFASPVIAGLVWFFGDLIFQLAKVPYPAAAKVLFISLFAIDLLWGIISRLLLLHKARVLKIPYKAVLVGVIVYQLHEEPDFKDWDGQQFLHRLKIRYITRRAARTIASALYGLR